jgi:hypothetical protein
MNKRNKIQKKVHRVNERKKGRKKEREEYK